MGRLRNAWRYVRLYEPVLLTAAWRAVVGVLAAAGILIPAQVDKRVVAVIAAVSVLLTAVEALVARAQVQPNARADARAYLAARDGTVPPPEAVP